MWPKKVYNVIYTLPLFLGPHFQKSPIIQIVSWACAVLLVQIFDTFQTIKVTQHPDFSIVLTSPFIIYYIYFQEKMQRKAFIYKKQNSDSIMSLN